MRDAKLKTQPATVALLVSAFCILHSELQDRGAEASALRRELTEAFRLSRACSSLRPPSRATEKNPPASARDTRLQRTAWRTTLGQRHTSRRTPSSAARPGPARASFPG